MPREYVKEGVLHKSQQEQNGWHFADVGVAHIFLNLK